MCEKTCANSRAAATKNSTPIAMIFRNSTISKVIMIKTTIASSILSFETDEETLAFIRILEERLKSEDRLSSYKYSYITIVFSFSKISTLRSSET